jgi:hypothetical protein
MANNKYQKSNNFLVRKILLVEPILLERGWKELPHKWGYFSNN